MAPSRTSSSAGLTYAGLLCTAWVADRDVVAIDSRIPGTGAHVDYALAIPAGLVEREDFLSHIEIPVVRASNRGGERIVMKLRIRHETRYRYRRPVEIFPQLSRDDSDETAHYLI